jgi:diguanylate cyclase (GGDEF)-like protein
VKILVAEDSQTNMALLSTALKKLGHEVMPAKNGQEAIDMFKAERPDLIILDVVMDGIDGFQAAKAIREIDTENWIPIIFLSATVDDVSIAKGIDVGGDDYLTKPCSDITLAAKIKAMQRISDMRQKLFEATQKLYLLSSTDSLTGVYNRLQFDRSLKEILSASEQYGHTIALLFIDLDNFKSINDTFGHHIGDLLLIETAKRLKSCIRANDFLARLGGDEFAIILTGAHDSTSTENITQNIIDSLGTDYILEEHHIRNCASIGVAYYPSEKTTRENLILNADVAMYHAKATGRNNYKIFTSALDDKYRHQISLEHSLKFAMERNELSLTYQPIYNLKTRKMSGVEALISWNHPKFGLVSPNIFIPIAEETGLMADIGDWVLATAFAQAARLSLHKLPNFSFAINLSSQQFLQKDFFQKIQCLLDQHELPTEFLQFELTETSIMSYTNDRFIQTIKKFHDIGIRISIDDFGTGYSSLIRLKNLPIDTIKIEKTFVQDGVNNQNSAIIVSCLIALGKNLSMNVIAEGIETIEQLEFLVERNCPQGQGFYLSKPIVADQLADVINKEFKKPGKIKS